MEAFGSTVQLSVVHRKEEYNLDDLSPTATVAELRIAIEQVTQVPRDKQKLLTPRTAGVKDLNKADEQRLDEVGLNKVGLKITVMGPTRAELQSLHENEGALQKSQAPRQYHPSLLRGTRARNTAAPNYSPFGKLEAHPSTSASFHPQIIDYLRRMSTDPAILHICSLHDFRIGTLTELLPWEHPGLLGLNENMGQRISVRIRTDDAAGFRDYKSARRVLVHELAHNKVNDHPPEFKTLNSLLNTQMESFEAAQRHGSHTLIHGEFYQPDPASIDQSSSEAMEERRQRILAATMKRLDKEEEQIQQHCGNSNL